MAVLFALGHVLVALFVVIAVVFAAAEVPPAEARPAEVRWLVERLVEQARELGEAKARLEGQLAEAEAVRENLPRKLEVMNNRMATLQSVVAAAEISIAKTQAELDRLKRERTCGSSELATDFGQRSTEAFRDDSVVEIDRGRVILPADELFDSSLVRLSSKGEGRLRKLAEVLKGVTATILTDQTCKFRIEGHADSAPIRKGSAFKSNWDLSAQRAVAVAEFLKSKSVPADHLTAAGLGAARPRQKGFNPAALWSNRRVEVSWQTTE